MKPPFIGGFLRRHIAPRGIQETGCRDRRKYGESDLAELSSQGTVAPAQLIPCIVFFCHVTLNFISGDTSACIPDSWEWQCVGDRARRQSRVDEKACGYGVLDIVLRVLAITIIENYAIRPSYSSEQRCLLDG